jgi:hypothetical protein
MHTYHAETVMQPDGELVLRGVPFPKGERVEVVVIPSSEATGITEDEAWRRLAIESFFRDTNDKDSAYDNY